MENIEQEFLSVIREYERVIYKVCYLYTTPNATLSDLYQEVVLIYGKHFQSSDENVRSLRGFTVLL